MSDFEKELKKNLQNNFNNSEPDKDLKIRFNETFGIEKKKGFFTKRLSPKRIAFLSSFACLLLVCVIALVFLLTPTPGIESNSIIQIDVNPSIEIIVDNNKKVISVKGLNDEGKMIILNEDLENKSLNEVLNIIFTLEFEMGYLDEDQNNATIAITSENEEHKQNLNDYVNNTINEIKINNNDYVISVNFCAGKTIDDLKKLVNMYYPQYNVQDCNFNDLVLMIANYHKETKDIASEKLEQLFLTFKTEQINIVFDNYVNERINELDSTYQAIVDEYNKFYDLYLSAYQKLIEQYNKVFIVEDSDYQQALNDLEIKKQEYLKQKRITLQSRNNDSVLDYLVEKAKLDIMESNYNACLYAFNKIEEIANEIYTGLKNTMNERLFTLTEIKKELPGNINEIKISDIYSNSELKSFNQKTISDFKKDYQINIDKALNTLLSTKNYLLMKE